jgi:acetyl esterase
MPLDPQLKRYLDEHPTPMPAGPMTPQALRLAVRSMPQATGSGEPEAVARVEDRHVAVDGGQITVRLYTPDEQEPFPVLVYYHGGGFVVGDLDMVDVLCRRIANRARCLVVSVAYRLAPEHPFPTAVEDGYAALRWVEEAAQTFGGDPTRLALLGDSSGGTIATVTTLMARDRGGPRVRLQVLLYPPVDFATRLPVGDPADALADSLHGLYLPSESDGHNAYASPILADDLSGLPDALIVAAELDRLRGEDERYALRLRSAGVHVDYLCYDGLPHGFITMLGVLDKATDAVERVSMALQAAFSAAPG